MRKRKFVLLLATVIAAVFVFLLSSCGEIRITELNERLIIEAIGIDCGESGEYTVTVQALDSESPAGDVQSGSSGELTKNYVFKGSSVGEALNGIGVCTGKSPLYSQARVIIVGRSAAEKNIGETLDFFLREYTTRTDIYIAVSKTSAKDILGASFGEKTVGAKVIENVMTSSEYTGEVLSIPLYKFVNLLLDDKSDAYCPVIGTRREELSNDMRAEIVGTALFVENRLSYILDRDETEGLVFLTNGITNANIPIIKNDRIFTLRLIRSKTKISPPKNGGSNFLIEIKAECDIIEFESPNFEKLTADLIEEIRRDCTQRIKNNVEKAVRASYGKTGCDVCRFRRRLWLADPERFRLLEKENGVRLDGFSVSVNTAVKIRRSGKETLAASQNNGKS